MRKGINYLLGAGLSLLVTFGFTQRVAAQDSRIAFEAPVTVQDTSHKGKPTTTTTWQIFSMDPDGGNVVQLTDASAVSWNAAWSPDHRYISFSRGGVLYVMEASGEANGGRTFPVAAEVGNGSAWSPDGAHIFFAGDLHANPGVWMVTVNTDTEEVGTPVLVSSDWAELPAVSPDGTKVAFVGQEGSNYPYFDVTVLDLATGAKTIIESDFSNPPVPCWSPDGSSLLFPGIVTVTTTKGKKTTTNTYQELFTANADGSDITQVTNLKNGITSPNWGPDETEIAFTIYNDGIYKMSLETGVVTLLYAGGRASDWTWAQ